MNRGTLPSLLFGNGSMWYSLYHLYFIIQCEINIHKALYANLALSGGNTMYPVFADRLKKEITVLVPSTTHVSLLLLQRGNTVCGLEHPYWPPFRASRTCGFPSRNTANMDLPSSRGSVFRCSVYRKNTVFSDSKQPYVYELVHVLKKKSIFENK